MNSIFVRISMGGLVGALIGMGAGLRESWQFDEWSDAPIVNLAAIGILLGMCGGVLSILWKRRS